MPRPRRPIRRRTARLRRRWHRLVRPVRRPAGHAAFAALLALAVLGAVAAALVPSRETLWLSIGDEPRALAVRDGSDAEAVGFRTGDRLLRVDGEAVTDSSARAETGYALSGPFGAARAVEVERAGRVETVPVVLGGREIVNARQLGVSAAAVNRVTNGVAYGALLAFLAVAVVLYATARGRGYRAALARALLVVTAGFGGSIGSQWIGDHLAAAGGAFQALAFLLVVLAIPLLVGVLVRFPDGRFLPAWTRRSVWIVVGFFVLAIVGAIVNEADALGVVGQRAGTVVILAGLLGALATPLVGLVQKYRRTPDTVVRQRMKWVMLPLAAFVLVLVVDAVQEMAPVALGASESPAGFVYDALSSLLAGLAALAIPVGVLAGALNFRPWDADLWIARSVAVGAATLGLAAAFAGAAEALRVALRASMGEGAEAVAAALAAVAALAVFNPLREWLTKRADADLVRARERLTERLPLLLAGRQVVASPAEVGRVAIGAVREALRTDRAAVLDLDPEGWEVVAAEGVDAPAALAWAEAALDVRAMPPCSVQVWEDPTFVLHVPLRSAEDELVGVLALGTHGRGRGYSTEERKALDAAARPLAEALRVAERREAHEDRLHARIARLVDRLADPAAGDGAAGPAIPDAG